MIFMPRCAINCVITRCNRVQSVIIGGVIDFVVLVNKFTYNLLKSMIIYDIMYPNF